MSKVYVSSFDLDYILRMIDPPRDEEGWCAYKRLISKCAASNTFVFMGYGDCKISVIKEIRGFLNLSLKDAKLKSESSGWSISSPKFAEALRKAGAKIETVSG